MTTLDRVRRVVAGVLRVPVATVSASARIAELGETDSLTLAEIATALDAEFATRVPSEDLIAVQSIAELATLVDGLPRFSDAQ
jgi:acyl carrier protein